MLNVLWAAFLSLAFVCGAVTGRLSEVSKYEPSCVFCGNAKDIIHFKGKNVCSTCARELGML